MPRDAQKYLYDILSSCEFLLEFTAGRTVDDYAQDRGFRSSCRSSARQSCSSTDFLGSWRLGSPSTETSSAFAMCSCTATTVCIQRPYGT
jgi:hypothetical protein